jgi:hypothetical protein
MQNVYLFLKDQSDIKHREVDMVQIHQHENKLVISFTYVKGKPRPSAVYKLDNIQSIMVQ